MPLYPGAIKKPIPYGSEDYPITARVIILHIAVSNALSLFGWFSRPRGVESHFYVRKSGVIEQYRDTDIQADANEDANDFAVSIETQGMGPGRWNKKQLAAIKDLILWLHEQHPTIPLAVPQEWNGSGVGFHVQFPGRWDTRGATCPGVNRQKQYWNDIVPWLTTGKGGSNAGSSGSPKKPRPRPTPSGGGSDYWQPTGDYSVKKIQRIVGVTADGLYGERTKAAVRDYQRELGVTADGLWGEVTESAHERAKKDAPDAPRFPLPSGWYFGPKSGPEYSVSGYYSHRDDFRRWQRRMKKRGWTIGVDGYYGPQSRSVATAFQREKGLSVDGLIGNDTWDAAWTEPIT